MAFSGPRSQGNLRGRQAREGEEQGRDNNLAEDVNLALSCRLEKKRGADE